MRWFYLAGECGAAAVVVGIALWFQRGLKKRDWVPINLSRMPKFGISRETARKALYRLEKRGLVQIERAKGKKQMVRILKTTPDKSTSE